MSDLKDRITDIIESAMSHSACYAQGIGDWNKPPSAEEVADDILVELSGKEQ